MTESVAERPTWSMTAVARRAGVRTGIVQMYAADGLLPGYKAGEQTPNRRRSCAIPADVAELIADAIASGVVSSRIARLMRDDPARLADGLRALTVLADRELAVLSALPEAVPAA